MGHSVRSVQYQGTPAIDIGPHRTTPDRVELVPPRTNATATIAAVRARYAGPVQLVSDGDAFTI